MQSLHVVVVVGTRKAVRVQRLPALRTVELHSIKPHGFLCHVLNVDFEEYFFAFERVKEGRRRFRGVDLGLDGQRIGDLSHRRQILSRHALSKRRTENL